VLDLWKAAWDDLIWKAMISKAKATERELNRNPLGFSQGRSQSYPPADQKRENKVKKRMLGTRALSSALKKRRTKGSVDRFKVCYSIS